MQICLKSLLILVVLIHSISDVDAASPCERLVAQLTPGSLLHPWEFEDGDLVAVRSKGHLRQIFLFQKYVPHDPRDRRDASHMIQTRDGDEDVYLRIGNGDTLRLLGRKISFENWHEIQAGAVVAFGSASGTRRILAILKSWEGPTKMTAIRLDNGKPLENRFLSPDSDDPMSAIFGFELLRRLRLKQASDKFMPVSVLMRDRSEERNEGVIWVGDFLQSQTPQGLGLSLEPRPGEPVSFFEKKEIQALFHRLPMRINPHELPRFSEPRR